MGTLPSRAKDGVAELWCPSWGHEFEVGPRQAGDSRVGPWRDDTYLLEGDTAPEAAVTMWEVA